MSKDKIEKEEECILQLLEVFKTQTEDMSIEEEKEFWEKVRSTIANFKIKQ